MTHQLNTNDAIRNALRVVNKIMTQAKAMCLWQIQGPRNSVLEAWVIGQRIVIVQAYADGGWSHYLQSEHDNNLADATVELLTLGE